MKVLRAILAAGLLVLGSSPGFSGEHVGKRQDPIKAPCIPNKNYLKPAEEQPEQPAEEQPEQPVDFYILDCICRRATKHTQQSSCRCSLHDACWQGKRKNVITAMLYSVEVNHAIAAA
jgi:hypothetical protein